MSRPRGHAALGATAYVSAQASALFEPVEKVTSKDLLLPTVLPADEQDLLVAIRGLADDGNNDASPAAVVTTDDPLANGEWHGRHGRSISCESAPVPKPARSVDDSC